MNKKRYFIFGLGAGIIFATSVIFFGYDALGNSYEKEIITAELTDEEIEERAKKLGMVYIKNLPDENHEVEENKTEDEKVTIDAPIEEPQINEEPYVPEPEKIEIDESEKISVKIEEGMSSYQISTLLKELEIIDDKEAFVRFVEDSGASGTLSYGTFDLKKGMSFNEIIEVIGR